MTTTTAVQKRPSQQLRELLEVNQHRIQSLITMPTMNARKLVRSVMLAVAQQPQLLECDHVSILMSVMKAAQLGLDPTGTLGGAYLVPYKVKGQKLCTLQIGYRGLIDLARRGGQVVAVEAHVAYEADKLEVTLGTSPTIEHRPLFGNNPLLARGKPVAVYAVATLTGGHKQFEVMSVEQVDAVRNRSAAGDGGPWQTDWDEMARKTVVKRLCKYLPMTTELAEALNTDNAPDQNELPPPVVDPNTGEVLDATPSASHRLAESLAVSGTEVEEGEEVAAK